jgi:Uma2 family endonuclease
MAEALRQAWTLQEFLAWEERQEARYEFDGSQPVAMTGGTSAHDVIQVNLLSELTTRLRGGPCRARGSSLKVRAMGSIRYPGAFVTCTPVDRVSTMVTDPVVIFEILSQGTARVDRIVKNREYAGTASVQRYVMLEQSAIAATMFERSADGDWTGRLLGPDSVIDMPEIGIQLPLGLLYTDLDLSGDDTHDL